MEKAPSGSSPEYRKLITPNCSLTVQRLLWLFAAYVALEAFLGVEFIRSGAWVIALFIGLETLFVGAVIYFISLARRDYELVVVDGARLTICRREGKREWCDEFQRHWARVRLERDSDTWYPSRLLVSSHGRVIEIGRAMNEKARAALAVDLQRHVGAGYRH